MHVIHQCCCSWNESWWWMMKQDSSVSKQEKPFQSTNKTHSFIHPFTLIEWTWNQHIHSSLKLDFTTQIPFPFHSFPSNHQVFMMEMMEMDWEKDVLFVWNNDLHTTGIHCFAKGKYLQMKQNKQNRNNIHHVHHVHQPHHHGQFQQRTASSFPLFSQQCPCLPRT